MTPIHVLAEFLFWLMALLFVLFVGALSFGAVRDWRQRRRDERWVGVVLREAFAEDETNVRLIAQPYDWMSRPDFNLMEHE